MGANTTISWCNHTFNPWEGCTNVSPGCAHCYAETHNARFGGGTAPNWGKGAPRRRTSAANWKQPLKWNREAEGCNLDQCDVCGDGRRPRVFCASLADWLDDEVPIAWLEDLMLLTAVTPNLDWLLLTKRPQNWQRRMNEVDCRWADGAIPSNIWVGVSVEDQQRADERIPQLLAIPARVRFLSVEPLLGPVNLAYTCFNGADSFGTLPGIHWVIVGGESGHKARKLDVAWVSSLVSQCRAAGVPCFVKQLGARPFSFADPVVLHSFPNQNMEVPPRMEWIWHLADTKGGDPAEWPDELRVREFPTP